MTFLQPFILYGLPLILLPILIHLLNRLRYRTQRWAAMRFLLSAQKQSIRRSRLRQLIVLLMRMLAVLAIVLFLARPMTGGWSSFFSSGEPEIILLALDRSASMETRLPNGQTRRERVLQSFAETAAVREGSTVVLVENVYRDPQALSATADLLNPDMKRYIGPTDTSSDIPALLTASLDWLEENEVGSAEIWIAS
ncbi:MAG: BatA domain-containing protein, partial [Opitutales bacterium]